MAASVGLSNRFVRAYVFLGGRRKRGVVCTEINYLRSCRISFSQLSQSPCERQFCQHMTREITHHVGLEAGETPGKSSIPGDIPPVGQAIVIEPKPGWRIIDFKELWRYRELLYFLTWRDIKVRYKQTVLGVLWAFLQPFLSIVVFSVIFGRVMEVPSEGFPYPIFVCAGVLPWQFFAGSLRRSSASVVEGAHIFTKVYFPRLILPFASVGAALVDFAISFSILFALMVYYGVAPTQATLMVAPLVLLTTFTALGMGTFLSALNVAYRDFRHVVPFMVRIWMFLTPVVYPVTIVPKNWQWLVSLNPMSGIVDAYRSAILGKPFDWGNLCISMTVAAVAFLVGMLCFRRLERQFADIV